MNETPLEKNEIQLTSQHRLSFDKLNLTLTKRYQKREGRGVNAEFIDEYAYKEPSYYGSPKSLVNRLFDKEFMEGLSDKDIEDLHDFKAIVDHAIAHIDQVKQEIFEHITSHITIDLGETSKKTTTKTIKGHKVEVEM